MLLRRRDRGVDSLAFKGVKSLPRPTKGVLLIRTAMGLLASDSSGVVDRSGDDERAMAACSSSSSVITNECCQLH